MNNDCSAGGENQIYCLGWLILCVKLTGKLLVLLDMSVRVFLEEIRIEQHGRASSDPLRA